MAYTRDNHLARPWDMVARDGGEVYRYVLSGRLEDGSPKVLLLREPAYSEYEIVGLDEFASDWKYVSAEKARDARARSAATTPTASEARAVLEEAEAILLESSASPRIAESSASCSSGSDRKRRSRSATLPSRASMLCSICSTSLLVTLIVNLLTVNDPIVSGAVLGGSAVCIPWAATLARRAG